PASWMPSDTGTLANWQPDTATGAKPAWLNDKPELMGDVRREVITTDDYATPDECYQAADVLLMLKTYERLEELAGNPNPDRSPPSISKLGTRSLWSDYRLLKLSAMGIHPDYLRRLIVAKDPKDKKPRQYLETVSRSFGPMQKLYVQVEFSPAIDHTLLQYRDAFVRQHRFAFIGMGTVSVLCFLSMIWGLLKIDTVTKGYYSKWLFIGVPGAIIGLTIVLLISAFTLR
ncbi:MAG TPA: hypothetical protein VHU84_14655, partial [Lacipirellulaceae bacterium]|nr:hypothetical protein [Lacipirellulaceae bacterium]